MTKTAIIIPCWDTLCKNAQALDALVAAHRDDAGVIVLSLKNTNASSVALRDRLPRSFIADQRILSPARVKRLCAASTEKIPEPRFGLVVSNGFGLGHVTRMQEVARGLKKSGPCDFLSFSAALAQGAFYAPSAQYLDLPKSQARIYTRETVLRFFNTANPTHVIYDGNVLPEGLLSALAARPRIHLAWIRRGMWRNDVASRFMAQQALADLVIEPGDIAQTYDSGPSWHRRFDYCPPRAFLKTQPILSSPDFHPRASARVALGLNERGRYALLMLGACQTHEDMLLLHRMTAIMKDNGFTPVLAHWPVSQMPPPPIDGAIILEQMPIAPHLRAFDVVISAAGYNSFHEVIASGVPCVFVPQEGPERDQQTARAQYAADNALALMCRRNDVHMLSQLELPAMRGPASIDRLENWDNVIAALGGPFKQRLEAQTMHNHDSVRIVQVFRTLYARWKRGNAAKDTRFVLALDADFSMLGKISSSDVVITNSIDPVRLRRAAYKYLWLNTTVMDEWAMRRQFLNWLDIWKPQIVTNLGRFSFSNLVRRRA